MAVDLLLLLRQTREFQKATTVDELLESTQRALFEAAGYASVWLAVFEPGTPVMVRILAVAGSKRDDIWAKAPRFPADGDPMLQEILHGGQPVVVEDARSDPRTNKEIVAKLGNRTIVNVPLLLGDENLGAIGFGTFGDEGPRLPTPEKLEYISILATHVGAALARVRLLDERARNEKERDGLRQRLVSVQKIESLALLAGGVAHDFNNLLTVIANSLRFALEESVEQAPIREDLQTALDASDRATQLTRSLLALGRQQHLRLEGVELGAHLRKLAEMLRRLIPETIRLDLIAAPKLPPVMGDPTQLDQVFLNLCLNARDAMPEGGRLTLECEQVVVNGEYVSAHPWARPGRYVLTTVTDTGSGMAPEIRERAFEPFFTTKAEGRGTGLGLAVAAGIVAQHEGMIHCYSEVGLGTTFKVYLPIQERDASTVGSKLQSRVPHGDERILLAEDDEAVREIARRILVRAGYSVVTVGDGEAAVRRALGERFDLILLDLVMPITTGREAYDRIRVARPDAVFLFASGYAKDVLPPELLARTGVELVDKPYNPDELLRAVRRALDRDRG